jgi:predicted DNA-binding transcriptional regulator AlpA
MTQLGDTLLFKEDYCEIWYDSVNRWVCTDWSGLLTLEMVQTAVNMENKILKEKKATKLLNLNTRVKGTFSNATDWIANVAFPEGISLGIKHVAWVLSADEISKMSAQKTLSKGQKLNEYVTYFDNIENAKEWLKNQPD